MVGVCGKENQMVLGGWLGDRMMYGFGEADATLTHENKENFSHRQSRMNNQASGNLDTCPSTGISPRLQ